MQHQKQTLAALKCAVSKLEGRPDCASIGQFGSVSGHMSTRVFKSGSQIETSFNENLTLGIADVDDRLSGGLALDALHEIRCDHSRDVGAAMAFLCALMTRENTNENACGMRRIIWISDPATRPDCGQICPDGLKQLGLDPQRFVFVRPHDLRSAIWAAGEAVRHGGLAGVVFHVKGNPKILDLAVSRKLMLRAQRGGTPLFLLRQAGGEEASSAATRWRVHPAPSLQDEICHRGIGQMRHRLTLERNRIGRTGTWPVCWNPSKGLFEYAARAASPQNTKTAHHRTTLASSPNRPDRPPEVGQVVAFERAS